MKDVLESRMLRIEKRVDERGHLYGSVTRGDVHQVLRERGHEIRAKRIEFGKPIKEIGEYEVEVQVHPQVMATVTFEAEANEALEDDGDSEDAAEATDDAVADEEE